MAAPVPADARGVRRHRPDVPRRVSRRDRLAQRLLSDRPVVGLVGRRAARPLDLASVDRRLDALPDWSRDPLLETSRGLLMLGSATSAIRTLVPPGPIDSDDEPTIEFLAPRMTRMSAAGDKDWFTGDPLVAFAEALAARTPVLDEDAERSAPRRSRTRALRARRAPWRRRRGGELRGGGTPPRARRGRRPG